MKPVAATFVFSQDDDSCEGTGLGQTLTVKVEDAGGGCFLAVETQRWALDDVDAFAATLKWCLDQCRSLFDEGKPAD